MKLGDVLKMVVADCLADEVKIITDTLREQIPTLDNDIKKMGLNSFHAAVYDAIVTTATERRTELIKKVRKYSQKKF